MNNTQQIHPALPALFRLPLTMLPEQFQHPLIKRTLNTLFGEAIRQGELDFLQHKTINIRIEDAGLSFSIFLENGLLNCGHAQPTADLNISGKVYSFLLLGTRKEDADTLFFRRQLKSEGDTELGLFVKNFLDGLEPQSLPAFRVIDTCMNKALQIADFTPAFIDRLPDSIRGIKQSPQR